MAASVIKKKIAESKVISPQVAVEVDRIMGTNTAADFKSNDKNSDNSNSSEPDEKT